MIPSVRETLAKPRSAPAEAATDEEPLGLRMVFSDTGRLWRTPPPPDPLAPWERPRLWPVEQREAPDLNELRTELLRIVEAIAVAEDVNTGGPLSSARMRVIPAEYSWRAVYVSYTSPIEIVIDLAQGASAVGFIAGLAAAIERLWNTSARVRRDRARLDAERLAFVAEQVEAGLRVLELERAQAELRLQEGSAQLEHGLVLTRAEIHEVRELVARAKNHTLDD